MHTVYVRSHKIRNCACKNAYCCIFRHTKTARLKHVHFTVPFSARITLFTHSITQAVIFNSAKINTCQIHKPFKALKLVPAYNASLKVLVPAYNASLKVLVPAYNASLKVLVPAYNASLKVLVPAYNASLKVLVPAYNASLKVLVPAYNASLKVLVPAYNASLKVCTGECGVIGNSRHKGTYPWQPDIQAKRLIITTYFNTTI